MVERPVLSLCLIAKDSARTLGACLESIRPWVDEMIVVDTGSQDATIEIARGAGAKVFDFQWCDDFAAARNASLEHARGRWLFWMDSDDTIDEGNGRRLRDLARSEHGPNTVGYVLQVHCPGPNGLEDEECTVVDHVKVFRNIPGLRFDGRIHEQILPAIRHYGGEVDWTDIYVVHSGADQSGDGRKRKQDRDLRILHLELAERAEHPFTLFNLGMTYADMDDHQTAVDYLNHSIAVSNVGDSHLRKAFALLANSYSQLRQCELAAEACDRGLRLFPADPELLFRTAMLAHQGGRLKEAERTYCELINQTRERCFSSIDSGITGFKARHNLAAVYGDMDRYDLAELQWRHILRAKPDRGSACRGLLEALVKLRRYQTAAVELDRMLTVASLRATALLSRARLAEMQGDLVSAHGDLLAALRISPDEFELLEALCRFLYHHGDPVEAKQALQELSARVPNDGAVLHNLGAINMRLARYQEAVDAYHASLRVRPGSTVTTCELEAALAVLARTRELTRA